MCKEFRVKCSTLATTLRTNTAIEAWYCVKGKTTNLHVDDMTANLQQCHSFRLFTVLFLNVAVEGVPSSNHCPVTCYPYDGFFVGFLNPSR